MPYRIKRVKQTVSLPVALGAGCLTAWLITIVMTTIISFLVAEEHIAEAALAPAAVITVLVAAFISAMFAAGKTERKQIIICLASGGIYYLSLICCTALFFEGSYQGLGAGVLTIVGSSTVAGLLKARQKQRSIMHFKRHRKV